MAETTLHELEERYAGAVSARGAFFVQARDAADALVRAGVADGPHDVAVLDDIPADPASCAEPSGEGLKTPAVWLVPVLDARLRVADVRSLAGAARNAGAVLVVDMSRVSSFGCDPLTQGAAVAVERLAPAACEGSRDGDESDSWIFAVSRARSRTRGKRTADRGAELAWERLEQAGEGADAAERWGSFDLPALATALDRLPRVSQRRFDIARVIAEYLQAHPAVPRVVYPGLSSHPDHALAASVLRHGYGFELVFAVPEGLFAERLLAGFKAIRSSASLRAAKAVCGPAEVAYLANDARARGLLTVLEPVRDDARYLHIIAGLDDPIDIVDSLDQAMRLYADPPQP